MSLALKETDTDTKSYNMVLGLGDTGLSIAHYLDKHGIDFTMLDTRANPPQLSKFKQEYPEVEVHLEKHAIDLLRKTARATRLIVSPGVDLNKKIIRDVIAQYNCEYIGDIELFVRSTTKPIVAITGSNGKSTVTSLLTEMAKASGIKAYAGGNLGPPALDLLENIDAELFVLELSSFQLESTNSLQAQVSAVLNISPDHLDRHGDINTYAKIKEQVYLNAKASVINRDDKYVANMKTSGDVISFGLDIPSQSEFGIIHEDRDTFLAFDEEQLLATEELALEGESGILNSLAALALGKSLKIPMQDMLATLKSFKGLPHRLSLVSTSRGVKWFDDSKGTNIGATISSLRSLKENIILIAGGVFKGGDLKHLQQAIVGHVKHVILIGQDAPLFEQACKEVVPVKSAGSMKQAVELAHKLANSGDQVLLSPACASFDMYQNYIARGEDFEKCIKEVIA